MQSREVGSERGPGNKEFRPFRIGFDCAFSDGVSAAPVDFDGGVSESGELITTLSIGEP